MQLATKILICSGVGFIGTIMMSFILFEPMVRFGIKDVSALENFGEGSLLGTNDENYSFAQKI